MKQLRNGGILFLMGAVAAPAADWLTFGGDAQRTGWAQKEKLLAKDSLNNFGLRWQLHLDNEAKELISLTAGRCLRQSASS